MKLLLVSILGLFVASCSSSESKTSAGPDCNCIPGKKVTQPGDIDEMRKELAEKWSLYAPDKSYVELVKSSDEGLLTTGETDDDTCEYEYQGITHTSQYILEEEDNGNATAYWDVFHKLGTYKLGDETTEDPATCKANAEYHLKDDNLVFIKAITAAILLTLDQDEDGGGSRLAALMATSLSKFNEGELVFTVSSMTKGTFNGMEMYMLVYDVKDNEGLTGTYSIRFGAKHSPMAYVWSDHINVTYQGKTIKENNNYIDSVDGIPVN